MSQQKNSILINEHALNRSPVCTLKTNILDISAYLATTYFWNPTEDGADLNMPQVACVELLTQKMFERMFY